MGWKIIFWSFCLCSQTFLHSNFAFPWETSPLAFVFPHKTCERTQTFCENAKDLEMEKIWDRRKNNISVLLHFLANYHASLRNFPFVSKTFAFPKKLCTEWKKFGVTTKIFCERMQKVVEIIWDGKKNYISMLLLLHTIIHVALRNIFKCTQKICEQTLKYWTINFPIIFYFFHLVTLGVLKRYYI